MDTEWSAQHAEIPRFRIGGMQWFRDITALNGDDLAAFSVATAKTAKNWGWTDMQGISPAVARKLEANWTSTGRPQYFAAIGGKPLSFVKAVQILLSCELALEELLIERGIDTRAKKQLPLSTEVKRPELLSEIPSSQEIYRHMAIIPACWNVNDFNESYLQSRMDTEPTFLDQIAAHTNQTDHSVFYDLAAGHTVTHGLARKVKEFCDPKKALGQIRCRRGKGILGTKRAAELEEIPR